MTREVRYVIRLAGDHAGEPYRVSLDTPGAELLLVSPRAIYLAYTRDRQLHYAGKVDRRNRGTVAQRLREHTRESRRKRAAWRTLWVVPITDDMDSAGLVALERAAIQLLQPLANVQNGRAS
ncbi:MAG TPA: GIY-YIG nuclease family protein [Gaiellaceae bacterium]|nr:GIY-YIG nuclease family protein [Gaiellaceae bacterium]